MKGKDTLGQVMGLVVLLVLSAAGLVSMVEVYFQKGLHRFYQLNAPFDGRNIALHVGIIFTAVAAGTALWGLYRQLKGSAVKHIGSWPPCHDPD